MEAFVLALALPQLPLCGLQLPQAALQLVPGVRQLGLGGVQLPLAVPELRLAGGYLPLRVRQLRLALVIFRQAVPVFPLAVLQLLPGVRQLPVRVGLRSEERRVGKECL